ELDAAAGKVAVFLRNAGVEPGDFVSMQLPGWAEFTVIYIACLKVGAVVNPILPNLRKKELLYILNKCESKVLFIPSRFKKCEYPTMIWSIADEIPSLKEVVIVEKENKVDHGITLNKILTEYSPESIRSGRKADDLAAVLFTSGTEGFPKGVMLTHNNIIASEKAYAAAFNLTYLDTILMPAPVAHATGFHHGVTVSILLGAKSVLQDIFSPETSLWLIEREKCTFGNLCTSFVYDIVTMAKKRQYDISSLRFFMCGGSPVPRHLVKEALHIGFKVMGVYGSTESVPHTASGLNDSTERIINTDGRSLAGIEIKVVDEFRKEVLTGVQGEEASRGPNVFVGYLKEPELTARVLDDNGWYYSGDLCTMDEQGYIRINGRKKDIIIRGGENISSVEIENILMQHPKIKDAAVVGMPDDRLGERTCAYVVLSAPNQELTLEEVREFFAKINIAKYKYPERIEVIASMPRNESGKIQKYILREDIKNK
ncbi:MAG: AMP-binding protein, partial [Bacillota bacterium]|nr:AMP-binding protein [Bacillota bacterium]